MEKCFFYRIVVIVFFAAGFFVSEVLEAATVTRVNRERGLIQIDAGEDQGFAQGVRACIFGRNNARATCGVVMRASNNRATIRVRNNIERVRDGMEVRLIEQDSARPAAAVASGKHRRNIKLNYILTIMSPTEFSKLVYSAPTESGEVDSLWTPTESAGLSLLGFSGEFEMPITNAISLATGFRYRAFRGLLAEADYDKLTPDPELFALMEQKASALGVYIDTYFLDLKFGDAFMMRLSGGLDIDMSTVELNAQRKSDKENPEEFTLASVTSKATVISLRLGTHFNFFLDPLGLHTSLNILVPLTAMGQSISGSSEDPNGSLLSEDQDMIDDIEKQLAHGTGSVGLEFVIGASFAF